MLGQISIFFSARRPANFFFLIEESYFFGLIFQFLGKCWYIPSPPAPHNYCWLFCVFPIRLHHRLLIRPARLTLSKPQLWATLGLVTPPTPDDTSHSPSHASYFSRKIPHSSCSESRKFSLNSPLFLAPHSEQRARERGGSEHSRVSAASPLSGRL